MFKRLFGVAAEELRLTVSEALSSQRIIIAGLQAKALSQAEASADLRVENARLKAENQALRTACDDRARDLEQLKADTLEAFALTDPKSAPQQQIPMRKSAWINSSNAGGHSRRVPDPKPEPVTA